MQSFSKILTTGACQWRECSKLLSSVLLLLLGYNCRLYRKAHNTCIKVRILLKGDILEDTLYLKTSCKFQEQKFDSRELTCEPHRDLQWEQGSSPYRQSYLHNLLTKHHPRTCILCVCICCRYVGSICSHRFALQGPSKSQKVLVADEHLPLPQRWGRTLSDSSQPTPQCCCSHAQGGTGRRQVQSKRPWELSLGLWVTFVCYNKVLHTGWVKQQKWIHNSGG